MDNLVERLAGNQPDDRCCGDHHGTWDTPAEPGSGFCQDCLDQLTDEVA